MYSTTFTDTDSTYTGNAALKGGVFYADTSKITLTSVTATTSYANYGGVFTLNDATPLEVSSSTFTSNTATTSGGVAYFS